MKVDKDFEYVKCNLCDSDNSSILFKGKDMVHKKKGLFTVVKCLNCGLIYTNPRPNENIISKYYPDEYWDIYDNEDEGIDIRLKKLVHKFINKISYKMTISPQLGGKILDIGCGDGKRLLELRKDGWDTYGVEISDLAAEYVRERYGLNVITGKVEDARFKNEIFDVIILDNVLEHLSDPKTSLIEISRILKNDGTLAIIIPNVNSFEAKQFRKYWTGWELPRHLYHFTPMSIRDLLAKTGFEVLKIDFDTNPNNILSSLKYIFKDRGINTLIGLTIVFPFAILTSLILGKTKQSYNMAVYSKKQI